MSAGFGHYPFGVGPAGQWDWTSSVLFRLAPEVYRQADADQDDNLQKYTRGQRFSFDNLRNKIRELPSLRDPLTARSKYDQLVTLRLGPEVERLGALEQRGIDGTITIAQELTAPTGRFAFDDVGKEIVVIGSGIPGNNRRVRVIRIVNSRTVLTEPLLAANAVPFQWELRNFVAVPIGVRTFQLQSGYVDLIGNGWVVSDGVRDYEVVGRRHSHWDDPIRKSFVVKEGVKGYFDTLGNVVAVTQQADTFSAVNIGQKIQTNGANQYNVGVWEITGVSVVVSLPDYIWTLTIAQSADRFPDQSDYYWALLPREELDLRAHDVPRGLAEQFGIQGQVTAFHGLSAFYSEEAVFDAEDAVPIKYLSISGSLMGNDGLYTVTALVGTQVVSVTPAFAAFETGLVWALRRSTIVGDFTQVSAYPQPVLPLLAGDFGIFVDTRESEFLQRSNVDHVGRWVNIKGHPNSYRVLGKLTGMEVEVEHLWRISQEQYLQFYLGGYSSFVYERGEATLGRTGESGQLFFFGGRARLQDATAQFVSTDVGVVVRVTSANFVPNIKMFTVDRVISPTEVEFRLIDTAITPDYGVLGTALVPTVRWALSWLYTTLEPRRPLQDDMNVDLLTDIVDFSSANTFSMDRFCWETGFSTRVPCDPISVAATLTQFFWVVTVTTPPGQPGSAEVVLVSERWVFVDAVGVEYGLETVPVASGLNWQFTVFGAVAPDVSGPNLYLFYDCPLVPSCDFCASNWIYAEIGYGPELASETGPAVENIYTRVLERIEQVKPVQVRILPRLVREMNATLTLSACLEPHPWIGNFLLASLCPNFDDFPADFFPTDLCLMATVEPVITP